MVRKSAVGAAAILAASLLLNGESRAADPTATCQYLVEACADEPGTFPQGYCIGYVSGVAASYTPLPGGRNFCTPRTVTRGQLEAVTAKWLKANPEEWHLAPWRCVVNALAAAFPCPASGK
jgi:hypothetical protein